MPSAALKYTVRTRKHGATSRKGGKMGGGRDSMNDEILDRRKWYKIRHAGVSNKTASGTSSENSVKDERKH
jgi:hypothetical protein